MSINLPATYVNTGWWSGCWCTSTGAFCASVLLWTPLWAELGYQLGNTNHGCSFNPSTSPGGGAMAGISPCHQSWCPRCYFFAIAKSCPSLPPQPGLWWLSDTPLLCIPVELLRTQRSPYILLKQDTPPCTLPPGLRTWHTGDTERVPNHRWRFQGQGRVSWVDLIRRLSLAWQNLPQKYRTSRLSIA